MSGEHSSGARQHRGRITKTGKPRLRWASCEAAWRLVRFQPDYRLCKKWREQILTPKLGAGRRKQLIVALTRGFGVDWWRLCTVTVRETGATSDKADCTPGKSA